MALSTYTSKALLANLAQTQVAEISYDPKYEVFFDIFEDFPALKKQITFLLREIFHPYRNNLLVLEEFRGFFLKNLSLLLRSPKKEKGLYAVFELLFKFFGDEKHLNIRTSETYYAILDRTLDLLQKEEFSQLSPILREIIRAGLELPDHIFSAFLENYYSFKRLAKKFTKFPLDVEFTATLERLLAKYYESVYSIWKKQGFHNLDISWPESITVDPQNLKLSDLLILPDHLDLLRKVKDYVRRISSDEESSLTLEGRLSLLFKFIENPLLLLLHEELIKEIKIILLKSIEGQPSENLEEFLIKFFSILKEKSSLYPWTAFECIKGIGISILNKRAVYLAEVLMNEIIKYGFFPPEVEGIDEHWRIKQNPYHLLNIKSWLEIFNAHPEWCSSLLSALLLNLKLYGVSIKDTDLFQREITSLLNAPIRPVFNLVKQFCKVFPVYFNEIGAEGLIRDISTEIDELFQRKDSLLHFLRKFIHIENSSLAIDFIKDIFRFWYTLDGSYIRRYLPETVWKRVTGDEIATHIATQKILVDLLRTLSLYDLDEFLELDLILIRKQIDNIDDKEDHKKKILWLMHLYKLEKQKYFGYLTDLETFLEQYQNSGFDFVTEIPSLLSERDPIKKIQTLLNWLKFLKEEYLLSPEKFTPLEEIFLKRHVAVDIPSMYGRYREKKFDALGLTYRLEFLVENLLEELVERFKIDFLTKEKFYTILEILYLFKKALENDGISSQKFNMYLDLLENSLRSYPLSFYQYLDIFKGLMDGVQHIIKSYYVNPYLKVFPLVFETMNYKALKDKYRKYLNHREKEEIYYCISEAVIKDLLTSGFAIRSLDNFLKKVYYALINSKEKVKDEDLNLLLSLDLQKAVSFLDEGNPQANDLIYLGGKAYNLIQIAKMPHQRVKIPKGFVLTTEIFRCYPLFKKYPLIWKEYEALVRETVRRIEIKTGRRFNTADNPLLLSIRSGSAISMPGMMSSLLNVGLNLEIVEGLAKKTQNPWFAWDTYRRFIQSWAMAQGVPRDFFNRLMREHKRRYRVKFKRDFSGKEMQELALLYREEVEKLGIPVLDDPWEQLFKGIEHILRSWYHQKAVFYREIMEIAEEWGTAIIIQEMVFGNKGPKSGTGVTFTTSPLGKFPRILLWGDYTPYNQGEDIVSGLVNALPISIEQRKIEGREGPSLEEAFPEIYKALLEFSYHLVYDEGWDHQEIEFTFESENPEDLYILQIRDIILREEKILPSFQKRALENLQYLGKGIGVSGSLVSGRIVFSLEDILELKQAGDPLILLRYDTVPENIKEISLVEGLLTARGGQTSHAAIVASRLGKVSVVGCEDLRIDDLEKSAKLRDEILNLGDWITLNGISGDIYKGKLEIKRRDL
ncbi:MAG: PEP-utilizing enzyme [Caldimicrobium sp.]|nr:PEP-utilizing enzyme [Caldimicrobium sp.]MCX7613623.1 PEP-utilizing enzyme [Caldimicrobium sp.]MDW8183102.1 PEP/pyruvate-binding domain-containing protein [Caldimicrobium sp.]